jgi:ABC-type phosphate transport system ATPase subunit
MVLVPQDTIMLPGTVYDNVSYGPSLLGSVNEKHIKKCLRGVGLPLAFLNRDASKLSGGEKRRVSLARALALNPPVLLLDEPTVGIDPKNIETVERNILLFAQKMNLTVLWVTHYIEQAMRVSNRIANVKRGIIKSVKQTQGFEWRGAY